MLQCVYQDLEGNGSDVSAGQCALADVLWLSDGSSDDLGFDAVKLEDFRNGLDQFAAIPADVIDAANEGAYIGGAGASSEKCLVRGENQGYIGADAQRGERLYCLHAFCGHGDLDDYMRVEAGEDFAFCHHAFCIVREDFCRNRAVYDGSDFLNGSVEIFAFLSNQRGIGGDAGNKAHVIGFANGFYIGGINEKFHVLTPLVRSIKCILEIHPTSYTILRESQELAGLLLLSPVRTCR